MRFAVGHRRREADNVHESFRVLRCVRCLP